MKHRRISRGDYKCDEETFRRLAAPTCLYSRLEKNNKTGYLLRKWKLDKYLKSRKDTTLFLKQRNDKKSTSSTKNIRPVVELHRLGSLLPHQIQPGSKDFDKNVLKNYHKSLSISRKTMEEKKLTINSRYLARAKGDSIPIVKQVKKIKSQKNGQNLNKYFSATKHRKKSSVMNLKEKQVANQKEGNSSSSSFQLNKNFSVNTSQPSVKRNVETYTHSITSDIGKVQKSTVSSKAKSPLISTQSTPETHFPVAFQQDVVKDGGSSTILALSTEKNFNKQHKSQKDKPKYNNNKHHDKNDVMKREEEAAQEELFQSMCSLEEPKTNCYVKETVPGKLRIENRLHPKQTYSEKFRAKLKPNIQQSRRSGQQKCDFSKLFREFRLAFEEKGKKEKLMMERRKIDFINRKHSSNK